MPARCTHFGLCGGCQIQDLPYLEQLSLKQKKLQELIEPLGWEAAIAIQPSPQPWYYRNKLELAFGGRTGEVQLGLKQRGKWNRLVNLRECFLLSPQTPQILEAFRRWANQEGLAPYDLRSHRGILRYLVLREGKNTGQRMILLITAPTDPASVETLKPHLAQLPHAALIWAVSGKISDVATSERMQILSGRGSIEERLKINGGNSERTLTFQISPHSFFQTNTSGAEFLYSKIREWLIPYAGSDLYDLYCGAGGISLAVCELFRRILAVEANPAALSDAQENARGNHISNVSFFCGRVEEFLRNPRGEHSRSLAVLDPPRAGLHPKALKELLETPFSQLFYISCNPQSLVRDLKELRKCYKMLKIESVDLFPHTEHIEVLVHLCPK